MRCENCGNANVVGDACERCGMPVMPSATGPGGPPPPAPSWPSASPPPASGGTPPPPPPAAPPPPPAAAPPPPRPPDPAFGGVPGTPGPAFSAPSAAGASTSSGRSAGRILVILGVVGVVVVGLVVAVVVGLGGSLTGGRDLGDAASGSPERLSDLRSRCGGGDMVACDDLFWESPAGSDDEEYGDTCGRRVDSGGTWCEDRFGPTAPPG